MPINEQAASLLKSTLQKVTSDSTDEFYRIGAQIRDAKAHVLAKHQPIFFPANLQNLTAHDFKNFLLFKDNQHWDSLHRQSGWMTSDMDKLRGALKLLLDESLSIKSRLNQLRPTSGEPMVKGLGRAVITAILQIMFPEQYGVWNNTAEKGMQQLRLWPEFPRGASFGERYDAMNHVLLETAKEVGTDLWTLDMLWWRITNTHTPKGLTVAPEGNSDLELPLDTIEDTAGSECAFALEKYLHEFLVDNWGSTSLSKDWNLLEEDGEIVGSRYYAADVGEIDLLAKHRHGNKWLVIELKRNQTSDATVGQLLRYMSWVRKHLAQSGNVEGLIISGQIDKKMQYALDGLRDVKCMTYQVNFKLNPAPGLD